MDALTALQNRVSVSKLTEPAPTLEQLTQLFKAAVRAADHGNMRPWRFLVIQGEGLVRLGELFAQVAQENKSDITESELARFRSLPLRAPMIIVSIAQCRENPKVPRIEQIISAGAATQNLINAAFAMQLGAIWKTGEMAYDPKVKNALGLQSQEEIIGFIYLGTPAVPIHTPREQNPSDFFSDWPKI